MYVFVLEMENISIFYKITSCALFSKKYGIYSVWVNFFVAKRLILIYNWENYKCRFKCESKMETVSNNWLIVVSVILQGMRAWKVNYCTIISFLFT